MQSSIPRAAAATTSPPVDETFAGAFVAQGYARLDAAIDEDELAQLAELYGACFADDPPRQVKRKALGGVEIHLAATLV